MISLLPLGGHRQEQKEKWGEKKEREMGETKTWVSHCKSADILRKPTNFSSLPWNHH